MIIDEIVKNTGDAARVLWGIREIPRVRLSKEYILPDLRRAVNLKLMISEEKETDIRKLAVMSIKRQDLQSANLTDEILQKEIRKYDCHQTSLAVQKKVLLLMFMEKELGISMKDEEAVGIETLDQLAEAVTRHMKEGA